MRNGRLDIGRTQAIRLRRVLQRSSMTNERFNQEMFGVACVSAASVDVCESAVNDIQVSGVKLISAVRQIVSTVLDVGPLAVHTNDALLILEVFVVAMATASASSYFSLDGN